MTSNMLRNVQLWDPNPTAAGEVQCDSLMDESPNNMIDHAYPLPTAKKPKLSSTFDDEFLHWQDTDTSAIPAVDEIEEYINESFDRDFKSKFSVLQFWTNSNIVSKLPNLSRLAMGILSIPASSASSERLFSFCGNTISKKRSVLSARTVDSLLVLNSNKLNG